jgi:hypothetical protein
MDRRGWGGDVVSNLEKVARALAASDDEPISGSDDVMAFIYGPLATAAIDALADVDGIAGVLAEHVTSVRWARAVGLTEMGPMRVSACSCGWHGIASVTYIRTSADASVVERARHQAEAVVAHIRDQS